MDPRSVDSQVKSVIDYWFQTIEETDAYLKHRNALWWGKHDSVDKAIRLNFEAPLKELVNGAYREWVTTQMGWVATIVVLDQMSRNMYRGERRMFTQDALALSIAKEGLKRNLDQGLHPFYRTFCYITFEHSENIDDQEKCVELFRRLAKDVSPVLQTQFDEHVDYAIRHQVIIERFGRFPHRNEILGRVSTPEEIEFLKTPGSSF